MGGGVVLADPLYPLSSGSSPTKCDNDITKLVVEHLQIVRDYKHDKKESGESDGSIQISPKTFKLFF